MNMTLEAPSPVEVEVPPRNKGKTERAVSMYTELFRRNAHIPEALDAAVVRSQEAESLSVISAACSIGAEVDSLLAVYNKSGYMGSVVVAGYDVNPRAISAARRGAYTVVDVGPASLDSYEAHLKDYGFITGYAAIDASGRLSVDVLRALSAPVRTGHSVGFYQHDLLKPLPVAGQADLVLANNWLYHLSYEEQAQALKNVSDAVADNGVLSIGYQVSVRTLTTLDTLGFEPIEPITGYSSPGIFIRT